MANKTCAYCNLENPSSANFCRKCGKPFPDHTKPGNNHRCHIDDLSITRQETGKYMVEWNAVNADKVTLNGNDVTALNKVVVSVNSNKVITLRAENAYSCDVKDLNLIYDVTTVYRDRIVEKPVGVRLGVVFIMMVAFFASLFLTLAYAYRLESPNYKGKHIITEIIGHR